ncbi:MAG: DUF192 domain-containing protein [Candidatus Margulisbacteria bacterium]|jgi:uncharacterized membrane protein (UPF0127 family)|nr:DUF192 domain-containing protein [Candidatus Margulisiibacteriota bacterium]
MKDWRDGDLAPATLGGQKLILETAVSAAAAAQGLSGRASIPADGMLFVFPQAEIRYFWMKEMRFPLDIIWLKDQTIIGITYSASVPPEQEREFPRAFYSIAEPSDMVIEVEAGRAVSFSRGMKLEIN